MEDSLYLVVLILWMAHFLVLYRALRRTSLAPALFGGVLGIVGLGVLAAGALPHVASAPISELYHAPGATPEDQATLVLLWQVNQSVFDALFGAGLVLVPIGLIALGVAMLGTPAFGKGFGWLSVVLGVVGVVAASILLVDPLSKRLRWHSLTHRLPSLTGMEGLQPVEGPVGRLEDRREVGRAEYDRERKQPQP